MNDTIEDLERRLTLMTAERDALSSHFTKLDRPKYSGDPMMDATLETPNEGFRTWAAGLPATYWSRYDLSAARIGWEAALKGGTP